MTFTENSIQEQKDTHSFQVHTKHLPQQTMFEAT